MKNTHGSNESWVFFYGFRAAARFQIEQNTRHQGEGGTLMTSKYILQECPGVPIPFWYISLNHTWLFLRHIQSWYCVK